MKKIVINNDVEQFFEGFVNEELFAKIGMGLLIAGIAAGAAADRLGAELEELGFDTLFAENFFDFAKGGVGAAVCMRAAVDKKNLHQEIILFQISLHHYTQSLCGFARESRKKSMYASINTQIFTWILHLLLDGLTAGC